MRAVVIREPGGPDVLEIREVPDPVPGAGQVLVRIEAAGVNRADALQRRGRYPAPPGGVADVPGLEFAGRVAALGRGTTAWREGDRVMGLVTGGAYAEAVVVHEREIVPVPDGFGFVEAAALPEVFITAQDALFTQAGLTPGERVLIHAVGSGVGTAALQLATAAGAIVYGTARSEWKLRRATELGLPESHGFLTGPGDDWVERVLAASGGVDVVLDLVGGAHVEADLRVLAERGRVMVVGLVAGAQATLDLGLLLRRRANVRGTVLRARPLEERIAAVQAFRRRVLPLVAAGELRPVIDRVLPMADAAEAHRAIEANETFGKIVLSW